MASSTRTPFQDVTNGQSQDSKELKRQRDRERYANNKDETLKRRREVRELKKQATAAVNDENIPCDTQATRISGVTQIHNISTKEGMAPHVQDDASQVGRDDESDWLHRNGACQLQAKLGGEIHVVNAQSNIAGAGSLSELSDSKELKRQRDRERYANNKNEILKRRRELRELKKLPTAVENEENIPLCTQATKISGVTQIQNIATEEGHVF